MKLVPQHIDEIIVRWLEDSTSAEENLKLEEWKKSASSNEKYFNDMVYIFEKTKHSKSEVLVDTNKAWQKVLGNIETNPSTIRPFNTSANKPRFSALRVAATVAILVGIGSIILYLNLTEQRNEDNMHLVAHENLLEKTLIDGSQVIIQPHSSLTTFKNKTREFILNGKGSFTVTHNEKEPFILHHQNVLIKDIGTQFEVKAMPDDNTVEVYVLEGTVQLYTPQSKGLILIAGEKGIYYKNENVFAKTSTQQPKIITGSFSFKDERLEDVIEKINAVYKTTIVLENPTIKNCRITVDFSEKSFEVVIDIIAQTLDLWIKKENNTIIIGGSGCNDEHA